MSSKEIKQELIDKINATEDQFLLEEMYRILEAGSREIEMVVLSEDQKKQIDRGITDFENGNYLSNEEANRHIDEWLRK